ncbi:hypothetical protein Q9233_009146 [Columba guinea]|nr:hypothetical protein Q9233_009146 [Columba guinea]
MRPTTPPTSDSHLMASSQPYKHSPPSNNKPNSRVDHYSRTIQLVYPYNHFNRNRNLTNRLIHSVHTTNNSTRNPTHSHHIHPELNHMRTPPHISPYPPHTTPYPKT